MITHRPNASIARYDLRAVGGSGLVRPATASARNAATAPDRPAKRSRQPCRAWAGTGSRLWSDAIDAHRHAVREAILDAAAGLVWSGGLPDGVPAAEFAAYCLATFWSPTPCSLHATP